jgi:hypothetical protein
MGEIGEGHEKEGCSPDLIVARRQKGREKERERERERERVLG